MNVSHALLLFPGVEDEALGCTVLDCALSGAAAAMARTGDAVAAVVEEEEEEEEAEETGLETVAVERAEAAARGLATPLPLLIVLAREVGLMTATGATRAAVMGVEVGGVVSLTRGDGVDVLAAAGKLVWSAFFMPHSRHTSGLNACAT